MITRRSWSLLLALSSLLVLLLCLLGGSEDVVRDNNNFFGEPWWERNVFVFMGLRNETHIPAYEYNRSTPLPANTLAFTRNASTIVFTIQHEQLNNYAALAKPFAYFQLRFDLFAILPPEAQMWKHRHFDLHVRLMDVIHHSFPKIPWDVDLNVTDGFGKQRQSFDFTVGWKGFTSNTRNFTTIVFSFEFPNITTLHEEALFGGRIVASREHALAHYLNATIMLGNVSFQHLPKVGKLPFDVKDSIDFFVPRQADTVVSYTAADINKYCRLYGSPHANVLHQVRIASMDSVPSTSSEQPLHQVVDATGATTLLSRDEPLPNKPKLHRIFCGIFTIESHHESHIQPILDTWAKKCHHFLAFSNADDSRYHAISLPHLGPESYHNMWQKTRSIWQYLHENYLEDFDYFLLGGDDMFYVMENLHAYLQQPDIETLHRSQRGVYLGRPFRFPIQQQHWYNTGGPGYLLDRTAVSKLVPLLEDNRCFPLLMQSIEDVLIGNCLQFADPPIYPHDTRDALERSRFHFYSPGFLLYAPDEETAKDLDWVVRSDPYIKYGLDHCCSESSISFHYIIPELMYSTYDFFYKCPREAVEFAYNRDGREFFDEFRNIYVGKKDE